MRVLVLGGTKFLGRHVVELALARGHDLTLFNRGESAPDLFPHVELLRGDRTSDLSPLAGRSWDAVVDTSGYFPRAVRAAAMLLADAVEHYTFVSSGSVYADVSRAYDESAPVKTLEDESVEEVTGDTYGGLKALCERAAEEVMPGRVLNIRAGLIVGPYDPTGRFTYWPHRLARGGDVLAPEPRGQAVQLVDARDLAAWILDMAERREPGTFNANGPAERLTLEGLLEECRAAVNAEARLVWVGEDFLADRHVGIWMELPLWVAPSRNPDLAAFMEMDVSKALAAGLRIRPLAQTARDTVIGAEPTEDAGLSPEREAELLEAWAKRRD